MGARLGSAGTLATVPVSGDQVACPVTTAFDPSEKVAVNRAV